MASLALPGQGNREESEAAVYLTVLVAIVLGLLVQASVVGRTQTATAGGSTISYPASRSMRRPPGRWRGATSWSGSAASGSARRR